MTTTIIIKTRVTKLRTAIALVPVRTEKPQQQVVRKGILESGNYHYEGSVNDDDLDGYQSKS